MANTNHLIESTKVPGRTICGDIFRRPDRSFGFGEFLRACADDRGAYSLGCCGGQPYRTQAEACAAALADLGGAREMSCQPSGFVRWNNLA